MIPATGVRAPERTFVAVRAIAPVAGRPPTNGEAMLAMPWANSSTLELCRVPLIRSATTADSSDSIAPSIAIVTVGDTSVRIRSGRKRGICTAGSPAGIPPNRLPIVSTGNPASAATAVPPTRATMYPGTRGIRRFQITIDSRTPTASAVVSNDALIAPVSAAIRPMNSPGTSSSGMPKKSFSWVLAMTSAMPLVNPMTTGLGMNRTAVPVPVSPMMTSRTPAIIVHMNSASTPYCATMPDTTTTNAPVGPPICTKEPPIAEMITPVTIAQ
jgi:hypothetical protein